MQWLNFWRNCCTPRQSAAATPCWRLLVLPCFRLCLHIASLLVGVAIVYPVCVYAQVFLLYDPGLGSLILETSRFDPNLHSQSEI